MLDQLRIADCGLRNEEAESSAARSIRNPQSTIRNRTGWIIASILLLSLAIAGRVGMIAWPFLNDSGLYAYMGKMVTQGGTLYVDFYENKLPGAALICSAFWRMFGAWWPGYVLAQLAMALAGAALLARAVRRTGSSATLATFLYAAVFLNFCWAVFTGFQLEPIQAFFEILAAAAAVEALRDNELMPLIGDAFVVGLAAGAAAMLKPSGLAVAVAFAAVLALRQCGWRRWMAAVGAMAAGIAVPTVITAIYVWRTGVWQYLPEVWRQIQLYAQATPFEWFMGVKLIIVGMLLGFPLVVRLVPFRRRKGEERFGSMNRPVVWFAIAWFALDLVGVVAQRRMYLYHFYPLIPAAALLYGLLPRTPRLGQVLVGLLPIAIWSMLWHGTDLRRLSRGWEPDAISRYVASHTHTGDAVFADQIGGLLIETNREPGSRYGTFFYYINYDTAPLDYCRGILADFEQRRPTYVVLGANEAAARGQPSHEPEMALCAVRRDNFVRAGRRFDAYLKQHYVLETHIDGSDLYRRRDEAADHGATAAIGE